MKLTIDDYPHFAPESREHLREWLTHNHIISKGAWVVYNKKTSGKPTVAYTDLVDELLCFGWIDSTMRPIDHLTYKQLITPRKPKSMWSRVNKEKVERLSTAELIHPKGFEIIEIAKANGSWTMLDAVENFEIPPDLEAAFVKFPEAKAIFTALSPSRMKQPLYALVLAKTQPTRDARIKQIIENLMTHTKNTE